MIKSTTLVLATVLLAGCAATATPNYDARFGNAVREARQRMTLNPNAGASTDPIAGMDGRAAREGIVRYQDSFKSPPPVVNVINIGGSAGASAN